MIRTCNIVNFPVLIKQIRKTKNLTQKQLGNRLNLSEKTISAFETNRLVPNIETFLKIIYVAGFRIQLVEDLNKEPKELTIPLSK